MTDETKAAAERLESGEPINATEITVEHTPDGPLTTARSLTLEAIGAKRFVQSDFPEAHSHQCGEMWEIQICLPPLARDGRWAAIYSGWGNLGTNHRTESDAWIHAAQWLVKYGYL